MRRDISLEKPFLRPFGGALLACVLACASGCVSKEFSYVATVSGGEQVKFRFTGAGPANAKEEGFEVLEATIKPDAAAKKVFYGFRLADADGGQSLQSVRVEDVSEPEPLLLVEDNEPKFDGGIWSAKSRQFNAEDSALKWVSYISDSVRVYRFTLTLKDGRKILLHQPSMVPGWVKTTIRQIVSEGR